MVNVQNEVEFTTYDYLIPNFKHKPGVHCRSSAFRDVFEFHGFNMTEAMIFGLSSGMGLGYLKMWGSDPFLGGGTREFASNLCAVTGVQLNEFKTKKTELGWDRLRERLENNLPSAIYIDMAFLNYQDLPEDFHFGYHCIVVCGYNPPTERVLVADTHFQDILEIPVKELTEGRTSTMDRFMPPQNTIFEMEFPQKMPDLDSIIVEVLHTTAKGLTEKSGRMMKLLGVHAGIQAFDVFSKDLEKWLKLSNDELKRRAENQAGFISSYGTGGGALRFLFADFLKEAGESLDDQSLHSLSKFYRNLGDKWEELAHHFLELSQKTQQEEKQMVISRIQQIVQTLKEFEVEGAAKLGNYRR